MISNLRRSRSLSLSGDADKDPGNEPEWLISSRLISGDVLVICIRGTLTSKMSLSIEDRLKTKICRCDRKCRKMLNRQEGRSGAG